MQLVSGLRTGSAVVSAALRESVYNKVVPAKVRLLVMANAQLTPPVLYLMPSAVAKFCVFVVRQDNDEGLSVAFSLPFLRNFDAIEAVLLDRIRFGNCRAERDYWRHHYGSKLWTNYGYLT